MSDVADPVHEQFKAGLRESEPWVWHVAQWLQDRGHTVVIPPQTVANTRSEWRRHSDEGDLFVMERYEVKHLTYDFTCAEDWPHGDNAIVCTQHSYDTAKTKPRMYIQLNRAGTHALIFDVRKTRRHWFVRDVYDKRDNKSGPRYWCPISVLRFMSLADIGEAAP